MSFRGGGGGRGGRGGGGGGRSATTRNGVQIPMGTMTWSEFSEVDKQKPSKSYPHMEEQPVVSKPTPAESKIINYQLRFLSEQKDSVWWPVEEDRRQKSVSRFSDKYLRKEQEEQEANASGTGQSSSSLSLRNDRLVSTLQKDAFPVGLWNLYMAAETKRQEKEKIREEQRKSHDWKRVLDRVELAGGDHLSDRVSSEDEDEGQLDEYEDDEEDDYADNYFDNGEDDDVQEEGGEGAEGTYE